MPLPVQDVEWPPPGLAHVRERLDLWSAWYSGDPEELRRAHSGRRAAHYHTDRPDRGSGVRGLWSRFWGRPPGSGSTGRDDQLHVPLAADLAQASADLLYGEAPEVDAGDLDPRLSRLLPAAVAELAVGAEIGAALGGRYHRVAWDASPTEPLLTTVSPETVIPQWRWGRLDGATITTELERSGSTVVRHLERHELAPDGTGLVQHGLYVGGDRSLGRPAPLTEHPDTLPVAAGVDADGYLVLGRTPGLLLRYLPNQLPSRRWHRDPVARHLGRSDYDGAEGVLDALDEVYSSWMRDVRLAKGRIIVPAYMVRPGAPGQPGLPDLDREAFVAVSSADAGEGGSLPVSPVQFSIRVAEHEATARELTATIIRTAGYSPGTLGETRDAGGAVVTATEIAARERRSYLTRSRKLRHETPAVAGLLAKMLSVATGAAVPADAVDVQYADAVEEQPEVVARTLQMLDAASAVTTETKVRMLHPDWDDPRVAQEVAGLMSERPATVVDPFGV